MNFKPVDGLGDVGYAPLGAGEVYPDTEGHFSRGVDSVGQMNFSRFCVL